MFHGDALKNIPSDGIPDRFSSRAASPTFSSISVPAVKQAENFCQ